MRKGKKKGKKKKKQTMTSVMICRAFKTVTGLRKCRENCKNHAVENRFQ